jgi:hypothetical protein
MLQFGQQRRGIGKGKADPFASEIAQATKDTIS